VFYHLKQFLFEYLHRSKSGVLFCWGTNNLHFLFLFLQTA